MNISLENTLIQLDPTTLRQFKNSVDTFIRMCDRNCTRKMNVAELSSYLKRENLVDLMNCLQMSIRAVQSLNVMELSEKVKKLRTEFYDYVHQRLIREAAIAQKCFCENTIGILIFQAKDCNNKYRKHKYSYEYIIATFTFCVIAEALFPYIEKEYINKYNSFIA